MENANHNSAVSLYCVKVPWFQKLVEHYSGQSGHPRDIGKVSSCIWEVSFFKGCIYCTQTAGCLGQQNMSCILRCPHFRVCWLERLHCISGYAMLDWQWLIGLHVWFNTVKHSLKTVQQLGKLLCKWGIIGESWKGEDVQPHSLWYPVRSRILQLVRYHCTPRYEVAPLILKIQ